MTIPTKNAAVAKKIIFSVFYEKVTKQTQKYPIKNWFSSDKNNLFRNHAYMNKTQ